MADNFNSLLDGLIGNSLDAPAPQPESNDKEEKGKKEEEKDIDVKTSHFCTIVRKDVQRKIRLIAIKESLQIKDVVEAALLKAVESYERKHGKIEGDIKGNAKNLF